MNWDRVTNNGVYFMNIRSARLNKLSRQARKQMAKQGDKKAERQRIAIGMKAYEAKHGKDGG